MTAFLRVVAYTLFFATQWTAVQAQDVPPPPAKGPVYVVTFIDVAPGVIADTIAALKQYRDASRKEANNLGADLFEDTGQANHFMIQEVWKEQPDYDAHTKVASATRFFAHVKASEFGPPDIRVHRGFSMGPKTADAANAGLYVMIHLDVAPPSFAALQVPLKPFVDASRKEEGVLRFDLLQHVDPRQNHITVLEAWKSVAAFDAHQASAATKTFRANLHPILGALYDQRLYKAIK